jgi:hypothetical protein
MQNLRDTLVHFDVDNLQMNDTPKIKRTIPFLNTFAILEMNHHGCLVAILNYCAK